MAGSLHIECVAWQSSPTSAHRRTELYRWLICYLRRGLAAISSSLDLGCRCFGVQDQLCISSKTSHAIQQSTVDWAWQCNNPAMSRCHPVQLAPKLAVAQTLTRPAVLEVADRIADAAEARPIPGTVYTGAAGVAFALHHCGHRLQEPSLITTGTKLIDVAYSGVLYAQRHVPEALLDGVAGVVAAKALLSPSAQPQPGRPLPETVQYSQLCSTVAAASHGSDTSDEFLYGRAGTLFGALLLNQQLGQGVVAPGVVQQLVDAILASGRKLSARSSGCPTPLMYVWGPANPYLGAAHGLMGILYVLLHCRPQLEQAPGAWEDVTAALQYVLSCECDIAGREGLKGHYPVMMRMLQQQQQPPDPDPLVHWCHGSPGAVFLFCKAAEALPQQAETFLTAARRAGELVWERGLLKKGPGLCHGVAGNGYALLALYKATQEEVWLQRAQAYGVWLLSPMGQADWGVPDRPHSLYEGLAGAACFLADLVVDPSTAAFPFYELPPAV